MTTTGIQMNERIKRAKVWYDIREIVSMSQMAEAAHLFRDLHNENTPHMPFSLDTLKKRAYVPIHDLDRQWFNGWIAYQDDIPIGFLVGVAELSFFSDDILTRTQFWYVDKKYRGTAVAMLLLREFVKWSTLRGSVRMQIDTIMQRNLPAFTKMAKKLGFEPAGAYFLKDHYNA